MPPRKVQTEAISPEYAALCGVRLVAEFEAKGMLDRLDVISRLLPDVCRRFRSTMLKAGYSRSEATTLSALLSKSVADTFEQRAALHRQPTDKTN